MSEVPPPPRPLAAWRDDPPRAMIQRTGTKERGLMAWRVWVTAGLMEYSGEAGTYAWTRKGAERKAGRLMKKYLRSQRGPEIEVQP